MNSKTRRAMLHNLAKGMTGPYLAENKRLLIQESKLKPGLVGWRNYDVKPKWSICKVTGRIGQTLPYNLKRISGMSKPGVVKNKTAIAFDKRTK